MLTNKQINQDIEEELNILNNKNKIEALKELIEQTKRTIDYIYNPPANVERFERLANLQFLCNYVKKEEMLNIKLKREIRNNLKRNIQNF